MILWHQGTSLSHDIKQVECKNNMIHYYFNVVQNFAFLQRWTKNYHFSWQWKLFQVCFIMGGFVCTN